MANWYGTSRSNYFAVKDKALFLEDAKAVGFGIWDDREDGKVGLYADDGSDGFWPSEFLDADGNVEEISLEEFALKHLAPGEVAIFQSTGAEKLRYVTGWAKAVHSDGRIINIDIDDIYQRVVDEFGVTPNSCTY